MKQEILRADPAITTRAFGDVEVCPDGLQPFLFISNEGTILVQNHTSRKTNGTRRQNFHWQNDTMISRDGGHTYERFIFDPNADDPYMEGGMVQRPDGSILLMDTYVVSDPDREDWGIGEAWISHDDMQTFEGPIKTAYHIPDVDFTCSSDDGGHKHDAIRLHRSLINLPDGSLMITLYGWLKGDGAPAGYMPAMMKTRVMVARSTDGGMTWEYVSTVAYDAGIGSEGFDEPSLALIKSGPHAGRLLCAMRTGRALYMAHSDDLGRTWSDFKTPDLGTDVFAFSKWRAQFETLMKESTLVYRSLAGSMVDPDIIQMSNGLIALSYGVRIPEKLCWKDPTHPENGVYCAFSRDGGDTWSHVIRLLSGEMTTHYTALREISPGTLLYHYDVGAWGKPGRAARSCRVKVEYEA